MTTRFCGLTDDHLTDCYFLWFIQVYDFVAIETLQYTLLCRLVVSTWDAISCPAGNVGILDIDKLLYTIVYLNLYIQLWN